MSEIDNWIFSLLFSNMKKGGVRHESFFWYVDWLGSYYSCCNRVLLLTYLVRWSCNNLRPNQLSFPSKVPSLECNCTWSNSVLSSDALLDNGNYVFTACPDQITSHDLLYKKRTNHVLLFKLRYKNNSEQMIKYQKG